MMHEWYDVSLSQPWASEWDEPISILAVSPQRAAEQRLKDAATECDDWLGQGWDAHVSWPVGTGECHSYYRLTEPKRHVTTSATQYFPQEED